MRIRSLSNPVPGYHKDDIRKIIKIENNKEKTTEVGTSECIKA